MAAPFVATFSVTSTATIPSLPYDAAPPAGVTAGVGVSVDAQFLPPNQTNWANALIQACFQYQDYSLVKNTYTDWNGVVHTWAYPNGSPQWMVRFNPNATGTWQWRIRITDANGTTYSTIQSFTATAATTPGLVILSPTDARYFQYQDGSTFVGWGYEGDAGFNLSDPYYADGAIARWSSRDVLFIRSWQSSACIGGTGWPTWMHMNLGGRGPQTGNPNYVPLSPAVAISAQGGGFSVPLAMQLDPTIAGVGRTPAIGYSVGSQPLVPCKPSTTYRFTLTARTQSATGVSGGVRLRFGTSASGADYDSNFFASSLDNTYVAPDNAWHTITVTYTTGATERFFKYLFAVLDNGTGAPPNTWRGQVAEVTVQEQIGTGYGPNLLWKAHGAPMYDFGSPPSYGWDYALDLADSNGVRYKVVALDKSDYVFNYMSPSGAWIDWNEGATPINITSFSNVGTDCTIGTASPHGMAINAPVSIGGTLAGLTNAPNGTYLVTSVTDATHFHITASPAPTGVYTSGGNITFAPFWSPASTMFRWYLMALARYLSARWGYSRGLFGWELENEAGHNTSYDYSTADYFGTQLQAADAQKHLVSNSYDTTQPFRPDLWSTQEPSASHADIHAYTSTGFDPSGHEWLPPGNMTLETNTANTHNASAGALKFVSGAGNNTTTLRVKGNGLWTLSIWIRTAALTGSSPIVSLGFDNGPTGTIQPGVAPTVWTQYSVTVNPADANWHLATLSFDATPMTGGTAWFDDLVVTSPTGQVYRFIGDGTFDNENDLFVDSGIQANIYGLNYGANQPGGIGKPIVRGETALDARNGNTSNEATSATIQTMTYVGTTITVGIGTAGVDTPHGLAVGNAVKVAGATGFTTNAPNGTFTVASIVDATHFTYVASAVPTGAYSANSATLTALVYLDTKGVWLHNWLWGHLDSRGFYDLQWFADGAASVNNLWFQFQPFVSFMQAIPIHNGHYVELAPTLSSNRMLCYGQKDTVNGRAHFWVKDQNYHWYNVVNSGAWIAPTGTVQFGGMAPNSAFPSVVWKFDQNGVRTTANFTANSDGAGNVNISLDSIVTAGTTDAAVTVAGPVGVPKTASFLQLLGVG